MTPQQALKETGLEGMTAIAPREVISELADRKLRKFQNELIRGREFTIIMAHLEQRKMQLAAQRLEQRHIEGIGQRVAVIHPRFAEHLRHHYGPGCLHDPEFLKDTLQKNPFLRVRCAPGKTAVRVNGLRDSRRLEEARP